MSLPSFRTTLSVMFAASVALALPAQDLPTKTYGPGMSRVEIYGGYGYWRPFTSNINNFQYPVLNLGAVASVTGYFTRSFGVQVEGSLFPQSSPSDTGCVFTAQVGPVARLQRGRFVPFLHTLGGAAFVGGPRLQACNVLGWGVTGGGGIDYVLPGFHDHLAVRPVQADFLYSRIDNGPLVLPAGVAGGLGEIYTMRFSAGLTLRLGHMGQSEKHGDLTMTCSADPSLPMAGDPVTLSTSIENARTRKRTQFVWKTTGGRIEGQGDATVVNTTGLAPGTYSVTGRLYETDRDLQGVRDHQAAMCSTSFTVQGPQPAMIPVAPAPPIAPASGGPSVTCSADRAAINSGDPVTITAVGTSPGGSPLTYSYSATNGVVTGDGPKAMLSTAGSTPGAITVVCKVTDAKGLTATANTSVVVATPSKPAALASARGLCDLSFDHNPRRPDRVDNEAKACLDDIALALVHDPDSKLIMVGEHGRGETDRNSAERVLNAADYLTKEKGIDAGRIELRITAERGRRVSTTLVPASAAMDGMGTSFDRTKIRRRGEAYGTGRAVTHPRHRRRRKHVVSAVTPPPA